MCRWLVLTAPLLVSSACRRDAQPPSTAVAVPVAASAAVPSSSSSSPAPAASAASSTAAAPIVPASSAVPATTAEEPVRTSVQERGFRWVPVQMGPGPIADDYGVWMRGEMSPADIKRVLAQNHGRMRMCYEEGLRRNARLEGGVRVEFVISRDGSVASAVNAGSDLPDRAVVHCIVNAFSSFAFPMPTSAAPVAILSPRLVFYPH